MLKPIKLAFLWHFHQPYYNYNGEMLLPWARLHAVKDYRDLLKTFTGYPQIKHTINLTPSLFRQLNYYCTGETTDTFLLLSEKLAKNLTSEDKSYLRTNFFKINQKNLLDPYPGYVRLKKKSDSDNEMTTQDYLDLQVWHNLAWLGNESKKDPFIQHLITKEQNYTEGEKKVLLDYQVEIIKDIVPQLHRNLSIGNICCSFSPYYHPILPLLSSGSDIISDISYNNKESAEWHLTEGKRYISETLGIETQGSWPSEGSLSDEILDMYIREGIKWVATDESMLFKSDIDFDDDTAKFFPHEYKNANGSIKIFFRDTFLSDMIGFRYMDWEAKAAAEDFTSHLLSIRKAIIDKHGEEGLDNTVVSIILDGENCWEFYENNGYFFLESLLKEIKTNDNIVTVFHDDMLQTTALGLHSINPGSWINADFKIWDGHAEDKTAWGYLKNAALVLKEKHQHPNYLKALNHLRICEGSDWYWWFGPEHQAPDRIKFDYLFRQNLIRLYELLEITPPAYLSKPIMEVPSDSADLLIGANYHELYSYLESSMHRAGLYPVSIYLAEGGTALLIRYSQEINAHDLKIQSGDTYVGISGIKTTAKNVSIIKIESNEILIEPLTRISQTLILETQGEVLEIAIP